MSVIVADLLPADGPNSWAAIRAELKSRAQSRSALFSCFAPPSVKDGSGGSLQVIADVDMWEEHAAQCEASARKGLTRDDSAMQALDRQNARNQKIAAASVNADPPVSATA